MQVTAVQFKHSVKIVIGSDLPHRQPYISHAHSPRRVNEVHTRRGIDSYFELIHFADRSLDTVAMLSQLVRAFVSARRADPTPVVLMQASARREHNMVKREVGGHWFV